MRLRLILLFLILHSSFLISEAQPPKTYSSAEILLGLKKLNVLGSVLYIAAHPDDENTRLLAYLANERLVETAYLSCTRGDGGQNLIGPELGAALGVIRTQELLAARRLDGASQFFTRANDFGFSKTAQETFTIWDREQVLADMVWVIRQRRPDVLITRFPPDARAGHGHHQASAMLAIDAFSAAADPKRFPEQLQYVQPWQPKRLLWNTGSFFVKPTDDLSKFLKLDAGGYNPLLGQSYGEIAARSRSQHRSQGFGSAAQRGEALEYFTPLKDGEAVPKELFEGVDMSWNRVPGGAAVGKLIEEVIRKYDAGNPSASVAGLLKVREALAKMMTSSASKNVDYVGDFWDKEKADEIEKLMQACLGLQVEVIASEATIVSDSGSVFNYEIINRSAQPIKVVGVQLLDEFSHGGSRNRMQGVVLNKNQKNNGKIKTDTFGYTISQPYWLQKPGAIGMYVVDKQFLRGTPENAEYPERIEAVCSILISDGMPNTSQLNIKVPVQYKHTDPTLGELYQPLAVVPPVLVNLPAARAYVFADGQPRTVPVTLRAGRAGVAGSLALALPAGWQCVPAAAPFDLKAKDEELTVNFQVQPLPAAAPGPATLRAIATLNAPLSPGEGPGVRQYSRGIQTINYPHIPTQTLFPEAVAPLVKLDVQRGKARTVGYLMGAGDEVPEALRQLGYAVTLLDAATDLTADKLARFDAVVLGIRAYNTVERLKTQQPELLKYVEKGGNLVVQYTVNRGTVLPQIGPYPLTLSNDRVTVETAPVSFLAPQHPLLNTPNKLTPADFTGWVQEQGLYYPSAWDAKYTPVIASHDPGEDDKKSAILVADYGKGHYIYTGLSFFRELPAGVPGAYRILANLVSYGR